MTSAKLTAVMPALPLRSSASTSEAAGSPAKAAIKAYASNNVVRRRRAADAPPSTLLPSHALEGVRRSGRQATAKNR